MSHRVLHLPFLPQDAAKPVCASSPRFYGTAPCGLFPFQPSSMLTMTLTQPTHPSSLAHWHDQHKESHCPSALKFKMHCSSKLRGGKLPPGLVWHLGQENQSHLPSVRLLQWPAHSPGQNKLLMSQNHCLAAPSSSSPAHTKLPCSCLFLPHPEVQLPFIYLTLTPVNTSVRSRDTHGQQSRTHSSLLSANASPHRLFCMLGEHL